MLKRGKFRCFEVFKFFFLIVSLVILLLFVSVSASQTNSSAYGMDIEVSTGGGGISSSNYKTDIISGTITGNTSSSSYAQSLGFFSCIPYTCSDLGYECGTWDDGCGGTLNCGTCPSGYVCTSGNCVAEAVTAPSAGGGAAAEVITGPNFTLSKDLIHITIKQGESKREIIEIKNTGSSILNISLNLEGIEKFMAVSEKSFSLSSQETKSIFVDIFAKEEEIPEAYTGRIIITGNNIKKIINVIIEVKERKPLFDVIIDVLSKEVLAGKNVKAKLKVLNLGDLRNIDIKIYYSIQDFDENILAFKEESIAINEELKVTRTLKVPQGTPVGDYVFYFKASYLNISASSTETFEVVEREAPSLFLILLIFGIILMIVILIFIFIIFKRFLKHINKKREIKEIKIKEKPQEKVKIEPKKGSEGEVQEKKEPEVIKLIRPKITTKEIKEKKKPKNKVKRTINKSVKEEKRILKKEKKVKRKLLKKIKKAIKKKKRKQKIDDLKRAIEKKKKNLEYKKKVKKEIRESKRRKKPLYRLEEIRRKGYENLLKKIVAMKKKKNPQEYNPHLASKIESLKEQIRKKGIK